MPAIIASPAMSALMEKVRRYAIINGAVLVEGESGAGKEAVARALHHYSIRQAKPWVDVSCATLPEHLVESELFGHEKGAFSGADRLKQGLFELADQGTLFLDEVGELETKLQVKLLRILDCNEYYRVGGTRKVRVNVRIVAATNQDLQRGVAEGWFRRDLYHRLAQLRLFVPPLRERPEDILALSEFFCERLRPGARLSAEVESLFLGYSWPGNIRELRNTVMACLAAAEGDQVELAHVPEELTQARLEPAGANTNQLLKLAEVAGVLAAPSPGEGLLDSAERTLIRRALEMTNGHQERAAKILGISSRTLSRKLKAFEFSEAAPRSTTEVARR
jgi:DNA-binding NtrC family response regulator